MDTVIGDEHHALFPSSCTHAYLQHPLFSLSLRSSLASGDEAKSTKAKKKKQSINQKQKKKTITIASLHCCITHFITYCYLIALRHATGPLSVSPVPVLAGGVAYRYRPRATTGHCIAALHTWLHTVSGYGAHNTHSQKSQQMNLLCSVCISISYIYICILIIVYDHPPRHALVEPSHELSTLTCV